MRPWLLVLLSTVFAAAAGQAQDEQALVRAETLPPHAMWLETMNLDLMTCGWAKPLAARSNNGNPLRLKGVTYPHGIGTHVVSEFTIDLKGAATRFSSAVGVDDESGDQGSMVFRVEVDGKQRFESRVLRGGDEPQLVSVDLTGAKRLVLRVGDAGDGNASDHADWAGAMLLLDASATAQPAPVVPGMGDQIDTRLPVVPPGRYDLFATLPRGREYAIVQFSVDGQAIGGPVDLFWYQPIKAPRVRLGTIEPKAAGSVLRAEVVGRNREASGCQVGIESVALTPPPAGIPSRLAWVKHVGGCDPGGMAVLPDGGVYVTGAFWGPTAFGKSEPGETKLTSYGERDVFLARYRPDGSLAWAKQAGGCNDDIGLAVAATPDGGAIVTGKVIGRAVFGAGEAGQTTTWAVGSTDAFVARFRNDGQFMWCKRAGRGLAVEGQAVVVRPDGRLLVAGSGGGGCVFGLGEAHETRPSQSTSYFLALYEPDGALASAQSVDCQGSPNASLAGCADGSAILAGSYNGEVVCGPGATNATRFTAPAGSHMNTFVAKYGADGALAWAKAVRPAWIALASGVAALPDGGAVVTGRFAYKTTTFGSGETGEVRLESDGDDAFIARYRADGTLAWAKRAGGKQAYCWGKAVACRPDGGLVVTGYLRGLATFGPGEAGQVTLAGSERSGLFTAWYRADGSLETAALLASDPKVAGDAVAMAPDGSLVVLGHFSGDAAFGPAGSGLRPVTADSEVGDLFLARYGAAVPAMPGVGAQP